MLRSLVAFGSLALALLALPTLASAQNASPGEAPPAKQKTSAASADPAIAAIDAFIQKEKVDKSNNNWKLSLEKPPQQEFGAGKKYFWDLETSEGAISIQFMPEVAPMHVTSTIYLTRLGFYDGTLFHRVIPGFMAQGGDPLGVGSGGPGYQYGAEFDPKVRHDKPGLLSMANRGPGTDGSQFFLTFVPTPWLNDKHTIFGQVVAGMDTLKKLEQYGSRSGQPSKKLVLLEATVRVE